MTSYVLAMRSTSASVLVVSYLGSTGIGPFGAAPNQVTQTDVASLILNSLYCRQQNQMLVSLPNWSNSLGFFPGKFDLNLLQLKTAY